MNTTQTRENVKHPDGGFTQTKTLTYYIVRFVALASATLEGQRRNHASYYLRDKHSSNPNNRKRRKWAVQSSDFATSRFETRASAMKGVRSVTVQKWLANRNAETLIEIVKVVETAVVTKRYEVEDRPGCNPLLVLALEAE